MANIKPFSSIRPAKEKAEKIAALPYDVYSSEEARKEVEKQPLSFLKIDRAETQFEESIDAYDGKVYQKAHDTLWKMVEDGDFITEQKHCFYIYELTMNGRVQTGLVACASIDDYASEVIKKHENTRAEKEQDRINHVNVCGAQTGPIFLAYRSNAAINQIMEREKQNVPCYDFVSKDGVRHRIYGINKDKDIEVIEHTFQNINEIYIADGHHRAASAVKVGFMRRAENPGFTGEEEFNYFLSVLFPDDQLLIMDYNRVVKDLNGYGSQEFFEIVSGIFKVDKVKGIDKRPSGKGEFAMYLENQWYTLRVREVGQNVDSVEGLDVSILQNKLLEPVLGISDPRTDDRIDFVGGIRGTDELEHRVKTDCKVAFALYPTSIQELFAVADAKKLMPPKSTWFEPKLRSGLFIHKI